MQTIRLLSCCSLFAFSFIVFAEQNASQLNFPDHLSAQEITELCNEFYNPEYETYNECLTKDATFDVSIINRRDMIMTCDAYSMAGMIDCLNIKAKYSQKILDKTEEQMFDLLWDKWNQWLIFSTEATTRFSASSKTFIMNLNIQCTFYASFGRNSGRSITLHACIATYNNQRILHLRKVMSSLNLRR